jgi:hypothetical protein
MEYGEMRRTDHFQVPTVPARTLASLLSWGSIVAPLVYPIQSRRRLQMDDSIRQNLAFKPSRQLPYSQTTPASTNDLPLDKRPPPLPTGKSNPPRTNPFNNSLFMLRICGFGSRYGLLDI